jgi:hypothetical protein
LVPVAAVGFVVGLGAIVHSGPAVAKTLKVQFYNDASLCTSHTCWGIGVGRDFNYNLVCWQATQGGTVSATCSDDFIGVQAIVTVDGNSNPNANPPGCTSNTVVWNAPWGTNCTVANSSAMSLAWGEN